MFLFSDFKTCFCLYEAIHFLNIFFFEIKQISINVLWYGLCEIHLSMPQNTVKKVAKKYK